MTTNQLKNREGKSEVGIELNAEPSTLINAEKGRERWIISLFPPAAGAPFPCQPAFRKE